MYLFCVGGCVANSNSLLIFASTILSCEQYDPREQQSSPEKVATPLDHTVVMPSLGEDSYSLASQCEMECGDSVVKRNVGCVDQLTRLVFGEIPGSSVGIVIEG